MQSTMDNPTTAVNKSDLTRIVTIDLETKRVNNIYINGKVEQKLFNSTITA